MEASGLSGTWKRRVFLAAVAMVLFTALVYSNSFDVPLVFDDAPHIKLNPALRDFNRMVSALAHTNRPLALFLNWANFQLGGLKPFGYHLLNLAVHLINCILVYLLLLSTPGGTGGEREVEGTRLKAALAAALFFAVHPVHTMAVTYVIQGRMVGTATLGVLFSVFLYRKAVVKDRPLLLTAAFAAFLLGLGGKELAGTAPFICLLYDRLFLKDQGHGLKRSRAAYHLAGFAVLALATAAVLFYHQGSETTGFSTRDTTPLGYLFTQFGVIVTYLRLLVFPATLKIHYQITDARGFFYPETLLPLAFLVSIAALFIWLGKRDRRFAFGILWFFIALAPTSSLIPIIDRLFEHRLYLPSIGFCFIIAATLERVRMTKRAWVGVMVVVPLLLGVRTYNRNNDWRNPSEMYIREARLIAPGHYRALTLAMNTLASEGRTPEAVCIARKLLKIKPVFQDARLLIGREALGRGDYAEAERHFLTALKGEKDRLKFLTYYWLGVLAVKRGNPKDAEEYFKKSLEKREINLSAMEALGRLAEERGDFKEAEKWYQKGFSLFPDNLGMAMRLADAQLAENKPGRALKTYKKTLEWNRKNHELLSRIGILLYRSHRPGEALDYFKGAAALKPRDPAVLMNLANCLFRTEQYEKAGDAYQRVVRLGKSPHLGMAHAYLGRSYLYLGKVDQGIKHLKMSCSREDGDVEACFDLGLVLGRLKRYEEAADAFRKFLEKGGEPHRGLYNLGVLYFDMIGDREKGREYLARSLAANPRQELADEIRKRLGEKGRK